MIWLAVFIGGGLGSMARLGIAKLVLSKYDGSFPLPTLIINVLASLLLAVIFLRIKDLGGHTQTVEYTLLATGFCGGFSTFSTFSLELYSLTQGGKWGWAAAYLITSVVVSLLLMYVVLKQRG